MAGGQATSSGIDYQQRIAAWCLINQYSLFDMSSYFNQLGKSSTVEKILFETDKPIDDLNLECSGGEIIYLQIKRSISLATSQDSPFYKSISQFVREFVKEPNSTNLFGIITTTDSSSKITKDLRKICDSLRLNINAFADNPLNKSEKDTLDKLENTFSNICEQQIGNKLDNAAFLKFAKRIIVVTIDIQAGDTFERACLMLLRSMGFSDPELIWAVLIKNCLHYASQRLSIDSGALHSLLDRYLNTNLRQDDREKLEHEYLKTQLVIQGSFSVGRDILLVESEFNATDYMLAEFYRFADDCSHRNVYYENKVKLLNGFEWTVIQRFSTYSGADRFLEENIDLFSDKKLAIVPISSNENFEAGECADLHRAYIESLIKENVNFNLCLHCGKAVNVGNALIIEIDDQDTAPAVGIVHKECVRSIDRILGLSKPANPPESRYLETFDFRSWISLLVKGQGLLNSLKSKHQLLFRQNFQIAWGSAIERNSTGNYCIKFILEDNSIVYEFNRSKIVRLGQLQAQRHLEIFRERIKKHQEEKDPLCFLSNSKNFGTHSELIPMMEPSDEALEIKSVEISQYSAQVAKLFDKDLSYYTPLCLLQEKETTGIVTISNVVPLISDPLAIDKLIMNWQNVGFELSTAFDLIIIGSDTEFDIFMEDFTQHGLTPIIDPLFDKNFDLASGYPIDALSTIVASKKQNNSET